MKQGRLLSSVLVTALIAVPLAGYSAVITQTVGDQDWNNAIWGSPAAAPTSGNDYVSDTGVSNSRLRIGADGSGATFGGDSLTLVSGTRALSKMQGTATGTINGDFILAGGWLSFAPNNGGSLANTTLNVVNFNVTAGSTLSVGSYTAVSTIDGILTGSGDIQFYLENAAHATPDQSVLFTDVSGYTGALTVTEKLGIEFGVDYTFSNTVTLQDADSFLIVNGSQTLTFAEGTLVDNVNGTVAPGTYTGASLDALGANYVNNGGTIVVIPEPATIGLIAVMGGGLLFVRRRFMM